MHLWLGKPTGKGRYSTMLLDLVPDGRSSDEASLLVILMHELGSVAKGLFYASIREGRERNAYTAEARLGLCDLITASRQLAELKGWDFNSLVTDGEERFSERMKDARRKMGG